MDLRYLFAWPSKRYGHFYIYTKNLSERFRLSFEILHQHTVSGQDLTELLKNAQSKTDELHSNIASVLLEFRMEVSNISTGIVNDSLAHILKALDTAELNKNESDELNGESEKVGKQISRCSAQADNDIQAAIKQFFIVFNPIHDKSFMVLNTAVEQLVEWNRTSDPNAIAGGIHTVLEAKSNEFVMNILPSLEDELRKFKSILFLIPSSVSRCVNEAFDN